MNQGSNKKKGPTNGELNMRIVQLEHNVRLLIDQVEARNHTIKKMSGKLHQLSEALYDMGHFAEDGE